ncbi:MAG: hypothetical protein CMM62_21240 [Rhodospirillaceae bacterium]|nr:hypothetical protein [Rhodospirillaceae bacterium]MAL77494.1 hypothetical protein [Rhodospirillaceae bacterium]MAX62289.1 hypothetical protein [Rhodospirillaceae bacterium]|tara:strand:+ start:128 stop:427 length:300 start_codon:yes stop_codon:yes gene_type:complete
MNRNIYITAILLSFLLTVSPQIASAGDQNTIEEEQQKVNWFFDLMATWPFSTLCVLGCDSAKVINEQAQKTFSTDTQMKAHGLDPSSPEAEQVRKMLGR